MAVLQRPLLPVRPGAPALPARGDAQRAHPEERQAFDWILREVPERTLYNWQNAAAKLVADDLRTENRQ
nr:hypothetical protein GCM10020093_077600 [Planobispora longispora]